MSSGKPLIQSVLEPGTCQGLRRTSAAPSFKFWEWQMYPEEAEPGSEFMKGLLFLDVGNASNESVSLGYETRCPVGVNGGIGVRAGWVTGRDSQKPWGDGSAPLDVNITSKDWTEPADMPRWTCLDIPPESSDDNNQAPWYRLLLTSIGDLPCEMPETTTAPNELSGSLRLSLSAVPLTTLLLTLAVMSFGGI